MFPVKCPIPSCKCDGKYYDGKEGLDHFDDLIEKHNNIFLFYNKKNNPLAIQASLNSLTILLATRKLLEIKIEKDK